MELYYKDLISEDASVEDLVDNLTRVVQGAEELTEAAGSEVLAHKREELRARLERLKAACQRVKARALASARAADRTMRGYPYSAVGFAFSCGLLAGTLAGRRR